MTFLELLRPNSFPSFVRDYVVTPAWMMTTGVFIACILQEYKMLMRLARELPVKVLPMPDYTSAAEPFMRLVIVGLVLLSIVPLLALTVNGTAAEFAIDLVAILAIIVAVPLLFAFMRPIWVLQGRFQLEKQSELASLHEEIVVAVEQKADSLEALLARQLYIESRTTWPISTGIQRIVLIGLLPPLTWILAAMVENLIY